AAKGLEFPYVFLCEMNEGIFPSRKTRTLPGMEEERRLAFVAVTRAEKRLFLSEAEGRNLDGSPRYPSRFVLDVDPGLLEYTAPPRDRLIADAREYIGVMEKYLPNEEEAVLFEPGDRIVHKYLGAGTVMEVDSGKSAYLVLFDSMGTPRSISFRTPLTRE
ncbi:MAG: ATP-binding domain-containing protein, partial [Clostridiales bacterium]|nr:ATP-binding domain-containing protein [Clostridiales bacterium]